MFNGNQTHHSNKWPNHSLSKEESKEDSPRGSEVNEEDLVKEEDEFVNQYTITPVGYSSIIRGSSLIRSVHTL